MREKAGNRQEQDVKPDGLPGKPGAQAGNPEGRMGSSRRVKKRRDSVGLGRGRRARSDPVVLIEILSFTIIFLHLFWVLAVDATTVPAFSINLL